MNKDIVSRPLPICRVSASDFDRLGFGRQTCRDTSFLSDAYCKVEVETPNLNTCLSGRTLNCVTTALGGKTPNSYSFKIDGLIRINYN